MSEGLPYSGPTIDLSARYNNVKGPLVRLAYVSRRAAHTSDEAMINLLLVASVRNYLAGISSQLWASDRHFVQVIEGTLNVVEPLYRRICQDRRHANATCIDRMRVTSRAYVRPLSWHRITDDRWVMVDVPCEDLNRPFDEICQMFIERGPITATR